MGFFTGTFRRMAGECFKNAVWQSRSEDEDPGLQRIQEIARNLYRERIREHLLDFIEEVLPSLDREEDKLVRAAVAINICEPD